MITGEQIRAARALLKWSASEAARELGISRRTIERLEQVNGVPPSHSQTLSDLQRVFEAAGIEFIGSPEKGPGVRLWKTAARSL